MIFALFHCFRITHFLAKIMNPKNSASRDFLTFSMSVHQMQTCRGNTIFQRRRRMPLPKINRVNIHQFSSINNICQVTSVSIQCDPLWFVFLRNGYMYVTVLLFFKWWQIFSNLTQSQSHQNKLFQFFPDQIFDTFKQV